MISKVFTSASLAGVSAGIVYLISFMPIVLILTLETVMNNSFKLLVVIHLLLLNCVLRRKYQGGGPNWWIVGYVTPGWHYRTKLLVWKLQPSGNAKRTSPCSVRRPMQPQKADRSHQFSFLCRLHTFTCDLQR